MSAFRTSYKVLRSFLFTIICIIVCLYVGLYVVLSVPGVQRSVKGRIEKEATAFLGAKVEVGDLNIFPFNEVRLSDVTVYTPEGNRCISIGTLGAGVQLWKLIYDGKIEITYAEIIGLDGRVWRKDKNSPLNIDFIIRAFKPKQKNKPPQKFDLKIHNVVIRKSRLSYDMLNSPVRRNQNEDLFDINHVRLEDFKADVTLPRVKNDDFIIDVRRLSFKERSGFSVDKLSLLAHITSNRLDVNDIYLRMPGSEIKVSDLTLKYKSFKDISNSLSSGSHLIQISANRLALSDFSAFYAPLKDFGGNYKFDADLSGNMSDFNVEQFNFRDDANDISANFRAELTGLPDIRNASGKLESFEFFSSSEQIQNFMRLIPSIDSKVAEKINKVGNVKIVASGNFSYPRKSSDFIAEVISGIGSLNAECDLSWNNDKSVDISADVDSEDLDLGLILSTDRLGKASFESTLDTHIAWKNVDGLADVTVSKLEFGGETLTNIAVSGEKNGKSVTGEISVDNELIKLVSFAEVELDGKDSKWNIQADLNRFIPSRFNILPKFRGYVLSSSLNVDLEGNNIDNMLGVVDVKNFKFEHPSLKSLHISDLTVRSEKVDSIKTWTLSSDYLNGNVIGDFSLPKIISFTKGMAARSVPTLIKPAAEERFNDNAKFSFAVKPCDEIVNFFSFPVRPYTDINISGEVDGSSGVASVDIDAPYLIQGASKIIRGTKIGATLDAVAGLSANIKSLVPAKNDEADIDVTISALSDKINTGIGWKFRKNKTAEGNVDLIAGLSKNPLTGKPEVDVEITPSSFRLNGSEWKIDRSTVAYKDNALDVHDLRVWHAGQFVTVNGRSSTSSLDALKVKLAGIDLSYIFEALNINYVTFGGIATGEISASDIFSKMPVLRTERLFVKDLSYNGAVLGDGNLESHWVNDSKKVAINADIRRNSHRVALIGGGIFVTRDSLAFDMLADHVNIEFLKPFMSAFTSDVGGEASGRVKLYGNFHDIDLVGNVFADSISMKVDYTNVYYHGSDSVHIYPGHIDIPQFKLYDKYGNSALLKGFVKHRYFHDPEFEFRLTDARNILGFDTNKKLNPDWHGKIFASGSGTLKGRPGIVTMMLDMSTSPGSEFTFVLSETQTAADYKFLTFSDKKKEQLEAVEGTIDIEEQIRRSNISVQEDRPSLFSMDIRCSVTPAAKMILVMDPKAGDKITAHGSGPMQISYDTDADEMKIYGKYTLEEGNYNFSLQDLILRDFKINRGSNISFNGDPLLGILDITAAYRVNTNLSDLDKSFSTDRDLNRTNVPVDALLKVTGDMRNPEISFDIALPTLTQDVERKVKSIISTDDMLNRQIIYLLALNRFYTPEYMGASSNRSGELASVASSTLSSQLSNFMEQLTDKVTLSPSFRSDKGDFSDMEVDVALSSRLLDNRLLINGNFGYRDRSTSQSTFIGDFDIEYLLNKNGNLRLKAYNHFNDQNYYLRSALTTQGLGIIYRKDFDNPFTFLKRKKKKSKETVKSK